MSTFKKIFSSSIFGILLAIMTTLCFFVGGLFGSDTNDSAVAVAVVKKPASLDARKIFDFNTGWMFCKGEGWENSGSSTTTPTKSVTIPNTPDVGNYAVYDNAYVVGCNDETWQEVSLPHTYNDVDTFDNFVETEGSRYTMNGERSMYGGTAWYKKTFIVPSEFVGQKVYIEFESARQSAQIWVNGNAIPGSALNGFIAFGYDISTQIVAGENTIVVLCDNSYPYSVAVNDNGTPENTLDDYYETMFDSGLDVHNANGSINSALVANPLQWHDSHWQPNYGGLTGNCNMYVTNPLQLTLPLYSFLETEGTYIYVTEHKGLSKTATINVRAQVANATDTAQSFDFYFVVKDMLGNKVGEYISKDAITLDAGATNYATGSVALSDVKRWSPDYPYLYTVECAISQDGETIDNNTNQIGVRSFRATTNSGFFINGNYEYLTGWGQKPTMELAGVGSAKAYCFTEYIISQMKAAGGNYLRFGHCAGTADAIKACDKLGIIVTQPGVDGEGTYAEDSYGYNDVSKQIRIDAFRDMVIYFRNSPSILFWETANKGAVDANVVDYDTELSVMKACRLIIDEYDFAGRSSSVDENGVKVVANSGSEAVATESVGRLCAARETESYNKPYVDVAETTDLNSAISGLPLIEGEYNRYEARRGVWDLETVGFEDFKNIYSTPNTQYEYLTSQAVALYQIARYKTMVNKGLSTLGGANWIYSDSISHARIKSEVARASGEVDATLLEKESYWTTQVLYSNAIKTHIIGHWNYSDVTNPTKTKTVYVVSKAPIVTLTLTPNDGGADIVYSASNNANLIVSGTTTYADTYGSFLYVFENVLCKDGTLTAVGYNSNGIIPIAGATDTISTHGEIAAIRVTRSVESCGDMPANGNHFLVLDVEVVDSNGNRVSTFDGQNAGVYVNFDVVGDSGENPTCIWRGGYNSGVENSTNNKYLYLESGITRIALKTTMNPGIIGVLASITIGDNIFSDYYSIETTPIVEAYDNCNYLPAQSMQYYTISGIEPAYGSVPVVNPQTATYTSSISSFTSSLESNYEGSTAKMTDLKQGELLFNDGIETFNVVPHRYSAGEYLLTTSENYTATQTDRLFIFKATQNCTFLLLFRQNVNVPAWVANDGYVPTNNVFVSSTGIIYKVFEREFVLSEVETENIITLGCVAEENNGAAMYVFAACIPQNEGGVNVFNETFSNDTLFESYTKSTNNATLNVSRGDVVGLQYDDTNLSQHAVHLTDTGSSAAYVAVPFGEQTGEFVITLDFWMNTTTTQYARLFFQNTDSFSNSGLNDAIRLYFDNTTSSGNMQVDYKIGKDGSGTQTAMFAGSSTQPDGAWYNFRIEFDLTQSDKTCVVYMKRAGADQSTWKVSNTLTLACASDSNYTTQNQMLSHLIIATGGSKNGDIAVANIVRTTSTPAIVEQISIDDSEGNPIPVTGFVGSTSFYYMGEYDPETNPLPSASDINVTLLEGVTGATVGEPVVDSNKKRVSITIEYIDDGIPTSFSYVLSYSYYSEYERIHGKYFNDGLSLSHNIAREGIEVVSLYGNEKVYTNDANRFVSIPYEYCGAELLRTNIDCEHAKLSFVPRQNVTQIMLIQLHDAHYMTSGGLSGDAIGWSATGEIVTTTNGDLYYIFTKQSPAGIAVSANQDDFAFLTEPALLALKFETEIENEVFFFDDFSSVDPGTHMPFGWETVQEQGDTVSGTQLPSAYIEYSDEEGGTLTFIDNSFAGKTGVVPNSSGEAHTKKTYLNKAFSNQNNLFTFSIDTYVFSQGDDERGIMGNYASNGTTAAVNYIRFILSDGKMSSTFNEDAKTNYGIETYLNDDLEHASNGLCLVGRNYNGTEINGLVRQYNAISNIPKDTWFTINYVVDTQAHQYYVYVTYVDGEGNLQTLEDKTAGVQNVHYFLRNGETYSSIESTDFFIDKINNLGIGSSANAANYFKIRETSISQTAENTIDGITLEKTDPVSGEVISSTAMPTFHQLTSDYVAVLDNDNNLPTVYGIAGSNNSLVQGSHILATLRSDGSCFELEAVDNNGGVHSHTIYVYANTKPLIRLVESAQALHQSSYSSAQWTELEASKSVAQNLIDNNSYNYNLITEAYDSLSNTLAGMTELYGATIECDTSKGSVVILNHDSLVPESTVIIDITPNDGYEVTDVTVTYGEGQTVVVSNNEGEYSFTMPSANVTVSVTFDESATRYDVSVSEVSGIDIVTDKSKYAEGETVTITYTLADDENTFLSSLTAKWSTDISLVLSDGVAPNTKTFVMPAGAVQIDAVVAEIDLQSFVITTAPTDTEYFAFEEANLAGLVISATLTNGEIIQMTGDDISGAMDAGVLVVLYPNENTSFRYGDTYYTIELTSQAGAKITQNVVVTVSKLTPTITTTPTVGTTYVGQTLNDVSLAGGVGSVAGSFVWTDSSIVLASGENSVAYKFVPTDATNYNEVGASMTINPTQLTITIPSYVTVVGSVSGTLADNGTRNVSYGETLTITATIPEGKYVTTALAVSTELEFVSGGTTIVGSSIVIEYAVATIELVSIEVTTAPTDTEYFAFETFDSTGMVVTANYNDGTTENVTASCTIAYSGENTSFRYGDTIVTINYGGKTDTIAVTVSKLTPTITTTPTVGTTYVGQTLNDVSLAGGVGSVAGSFVWTDSSIVLASGENSFAYKFVPTDTTNYNEVGASMTINPTQLTITIPSHVTVVGSVSGTLTDNGTRNVSYGETLTITATIPEGKYVTTELSVSTELEFVSGGTIEVGSTNIVIEYAVATIGLVSIDVTTAPTDTEYFAFETFDSTGMVVTANYNNGATENVTASCTITYTGENTSFRYGDTIVTINFDGKSDTVAVTVSKATPTITTAPIFATAYVGQALEDIILSSGVASTLGSFVWTDSSIVLANGENAIPYKFVPNDTTNYNEVSASMTINPTQLTVTIPSYVTVVGSVSGTLAENGTRNVSYGETLTITATVPEGQYVTTELSVSTELEFVSGGTTVVGPTNIVIEYAVATLALVSIEVTTAPTDTEYFAFETFDTTGMVVTANYNDSTTENVTASCTIAYSGENTSFRYGDTIVTINYGGKSDTIAVVISKAIPTITTEPMVTAYVGQSLSDISLASGVASTSGSFVWTDSSIVLASGENSFAYKFVPTDTTNYNEVSASMTINPTQLTITIPSYVTVVGSVSGTLADNGTRNVSYGETLTITATIPEGKYVTTELAVSTELEFVSGGTIEVGSTNIVIEYAVATIELVSIEVTTAPTDTEYFAYETFDSTGMVVTANYNDGTTENVTASCTITYTAENTSFRYGDTIVTINYGGKTDTIAVTVSKLTPTITTAPTVGTTYVGQTLNDVSLASGVGSVAGSFVWTDSSIVLASGENSFAYKFVPTDTANYNEVGASMTINPTQLTITIPSYVTVVGSVSGTLAENGTRNVSYGETLTITATIPEGKYVTTELSVSTELEFVSGGTIEVGSMNIVIEYAVDDADYTVTVEVVGNEGGTAVVEGGASKNFGDIVVITITPNSNWELDTISSTASGLVFETIGDNKQFTMPATNVTIGVKFKKSVVVLRDSEHDPSGNVEIEGLKENIDGYSVVVELQSLGSDNHDAVKEALEDVAAKFVAYDITVKDDGGAVIPNFDTNLKIKILIPVGYNSDRIEIYYVQANGNKEKCAHTIEGRYVVIETNHFSMYVVAEKKAVVTDTQTPAKTPVADTNTDAGKDDDNMLLIIIIAGAGLVVAIVVIVVVVVVVKKKKKGKNSSKPVKTE